MKTGAQIVVSDLVRRFVVYGHVPVVTGLPESVLLPYKFMYSLADGSICASDSNITWVNGNTIVAGTIVSSQILANVSSTGLAYISPPLLNKP